MGYSDRQDMKRKNAELLNGDNLMELGFEWSKTHQKYLLFEDSAIILLKYNYPEKQYEFHYEDDMTIFKTVGQLKKLISILKGEIK